MNIDDVMPMDTSFTSVQCECKTDMNSSERHSNKESANIFLVTKHETSGSHRQSTSHSEIDLGLTVQQIASRLTDRSPQFRKKLFAAVDLFRQQQIRQRCEAELARFPTELESDPVGSL